MNIKYNHCNYCGLNQYLSKTGWLCSNPECIGADPETPSREAVTKARTMQESNQYPWVRWSSIPVEQVNRLWVEHLTRKYIPGRLAQDRDWFADCAQKFNMEQGDIWRNDKELTTAFVISGLGQVALKFAKCTDDGIEYVVQDYKTLRLAYQHLNELGFVPEAITEGMLLLEDIQELVTRQGGE